MKWKRYTSGGPQNPGCVQKREQWQPSQTGLFFYCTQKSRVQVTTEFKTAVTDDLYGALQQFGSGAITFKNGQSAVSYNARPVHAASCGPSEPTAQTKAIFAAANTPANSRLDSFHTTVLIVSETQHARRIQTLDGLQRFQELKMELNPVPGVGRFN